MNNCMRLFLILSIIFHTTSSSSSSAESKTEHDKLLAELLNRTVHYEKGASKRLTRHLLEHHDKHAPPDGQLLLNYELELVRILEVNEVEQHLSVVVFVEMIWQDVTLSWNPDEFGGIEETWLPDHEVWIPDVLVVNMISHADVVGDKRTAVEILPNGTVLFGYPAIYTVLCDMHIAHFPLDTQNCKIEVVSWEYPIEKLHLVPETSHSLEHYTQHEEWHLDDFNVTQDFYVHEGIYVSELFYNLMITRKPLYYAINLIIPSLIISLISIFGLFATFSASGERQERYTLGLTAILTLAVLALIVSDQVPHSSHSVPLLVSFFLWQMIIITVATGTTSFIMKINRYGVFHEPPPPDWVCKLFRLKLEKKEKKKKESWIDELRKGSMEATNLGMVVEVAGPEDGSSPKPENLKLKHFFQEEEHKKFSKIIEPILEELNRITQLVQHQSFQDKDEVIWYELAEKLEMVLMIFFLVLVFLPSIWLFVRGDFFATFSEDIFTGDH